MVEGEGGDTIVSSILEDIMQSALTQVTQRHVERHINPRAVEMSYYAVMHMIEVCEDRGGVMACKLKIK